MIIRIAVALLGLALGLGLIITGRSRVAEDELRQASAQLDQAVREAGVEARRRVQAVSGMANLRAAVSTDQATVQDLTQDELALRTEPGEAVAIGQRWGQARTVELLRRPEQSKLPLELLHDDATLLAAGSELYLDETRSIEPLEHVAGLLGVVAVAERVPLEPVRAILARLGASARLELVSAEGGERKAALELGPTPLDAVQLTRPVDGRAGATLQLGSARRSPLLVSLGALVLLLALGFAALPRRRPAREPERERNETAPTRLDPDAPERGPATMPPAQGELGRYTILRTLGRGGMAEVHLARLTGEAGFAKQLALKVLRPEHAADPVAVDHFLDEARLAAQLIHPNIVQISDLGRTGDHYFIAMEYVEGADLARIQHGYEQRGERMPVDICLAILRQILSGLHAAHTASATDGQPLGLVHRDVKSANVFVAQTGSVKVGDFGIAKARQSARVRQTMIGEVKGTAEYMAPEQRAGQAVDARADQYGVGAIAYELLAGELINLDLARLAHLGRQGWPHLRPLTELRPQIPPPLADCVMRALAYEPDDRYPSCEAFADALEEVAKQHQLLIGDRGLSQWWKQHASYWEAPAESSRRTRARVSPT